MSNVYTLEEVSKAHNISVEALRKRCKKLKLKPILYKKRYRYVLTSIDIDMLFKKKIDLKAKTPEVIYVNTVWFIYESKINKQ